MHKHKAHDKCVCVQKKKEEELIRFLADVCPQVSTSSYDSEREEAKEKER